MAVYLGTSIYFDAAGRDAALRLIERLGTRSVYTTATIDSVSKLLVPLMMAGKSLLVPTMDPDRTTLAIYVGQNPVVSHGAYGYMPDAVRYLRELKTHGELWVVDPRRTETARLADRHLRPRVGTDHVLLAHVVRELLVDGADNDYLSNYAIGVDRLRVAVEPFDRERAAQETGLLASDLADLVEAMRRHKRFSIGTGTGVSMAASGVVTDWLTYAAQIVSGSFEQPGGRWFNPGYLSRPATVPLHPESTDPGVGPPTRPELPKPLRAISLRCPGRRDRSRECQGAPRLRGQPSACLPERQSPGGGFRDSRCACYLGRGEGANRGARNSLASRPGHP